MKKIKSRARAKNAQVRLSKLKRKRKMADLTKAQLVEKMNEMKSVEGVMDTILEMSQEDIQTLARTIKTSQKGMKVHNAILFGVKAI